jgi:hypothetical protein
MKKFLIVIIFLPCLLFAQYYGERTTEQSFEQSELYFNSYYLNTFGLKNFRNVAVGLMDDPFLNLFLNPANLPGMEENDFHFYLDFRGDRTEAPIVDNFVVPYYYSMDAYYRPYHDPRWFTATRTEPEPTLSFGLLTYPIKEINEDLFIGGTYQFIHRAEKFYTMPYWIYNSRYAYDSFGAKAEGLNNVPIVDRFSGKDEMINQGHLFSVFAGYKILDNLNVGLSMNGIVHSRVGGYLSSNKDDYGNIDNNKWENLSSQERNQNYDHLDFNGGLSYNLSPNFTLGFKTGILKGNADQDYISKSSYIYQYKEPNVTPEWSSSLSNSITDQNWNQNGKTKYFSLNFCRKSNGKEVLGYYKYSITDIDLSSNSTILDTSFYTSRWIDSYNNSIHDYNGLSSTNDKRTGTGTRTINKSEGILVFRWDLTSFNTISVGIYYRNTQSTVLSNEPVYAVRRSEHHSHNSDEQYNYDYSMKLIEDKILEWKYNSGNWTIQIPVLINFKLSDNFGLILGVNRILRGWDISDQTTAYFTLRERLEDGVVKQEKNFGERYTQPSQKITENTTEFMSKLDVSISRALKVSLMVDPEWDHDFRIAQWWLSFNAKL